MKSYRNHTLTSLLIAGPRKGGRVLKRVDRIAENDPVRAFCANKS